jgi:subtilisin
LGVFVRGDGDGTVEGAEVILFLRAGTNSVSRIPSLDESPLLTNARGQYTFTFGGKWTPVALVVDPPGGFWGVIHRGFPDTRIIVTLPALPTASSRTGWWHETLRTTPWDPAAGKGIKIGVVDTGVGPHPALGHVTGVGAFIWGQTDLAAGKEKDAQSHGSHVCGIIGARPDSAREFGGVAPGADLFCARVFEATGGASQADTANAIDYLSRTVGVHLINLSLGGDSSAIGQDAIRRARDLGTLCVCAAGKEGGKVSYPAAYVETVAVSALGLNGWGPPGSIAASAAPTEPEKYGAELLHLGDFSNFGPKIATAAPGVGILSTVPERYGLTAPYASMNGTSMSSPAACARLAVLLAANSKYMADPPDDTRVTRAVKILEQNCRDIGLESEYEGNGVLTK